MLPSEETLPAIPAPVAPVESIESAPAPTPVAVAPMVAPVVLAGPGSSAPSAVPPLTSLIPGLSIVPQLVFDPNIPRDVEVARKVIEAALTALGLPYQWGGGALDGPTMGDGTGGATAGYDCSGLVRFAVFQATGKELPRTSQIQFTVGTQISWDSAQPGDLVFGNWQADGANHVAIYLGGGRMIEAPQTGQLVQISDVRSDMVPVRLF
ncbi:C40 family peptidase [Rhodococcus erythropolis]|uniref:C40 family peptidase n=1 Tax=Rhodococcus erythropolis TaxID=1833 RepID=UPI00069864B8|nr:NlpC/P60 family protein [Rhodococcus erythropolis]